MNKGGSRMALKKKKTAFPVKTGTTHSLKLLRFPADDAKDEKVDREREKEVLALANLIPGRADPPDFPPTVRRFQPTAGELEAFERFLNLQFPRRKFAALRDQLDLTSKVMADTKPPITDPIAFYRAIVGHRRALHSAVQTMNFISDQMGLRRHPLQICTEGCGKLFFVSRPDRWTCSDRCGSRRRTARRRADKRLLADIREENRKSRLARGPEGVARDLDYGSDEALLEVLRETFGESETQRFMERRAAKQKGARK
jgi:hypothetical protein